MSVRYCADVFSLLLLTNHLEEDVVAHARPLYRRGAAHRRRRVGMLGLI
jgi:hypothetical protein